MSEPSPTSKLSPFWTAHLLGWGAYGVARYTIAGVQEPSLGRVLLLVGIGLVVSLPLRAVYRGLRARGVSQPATMAIAAVASAAATSVWLLLHDGALHWSGAQPFEGWRDFSKGVLNKTPVMLTWSALYLGLKHREDLVAEQERVLRATALAKEAQLEMLRYQLQPHFLFNALNSLRALIAEDPARARAMVTELSGFLRYSLLPVGTADVGLGEEIASVRRYLTLEQVRFEERLDVRFDVEPAAESRRLPSFLLHPLAENAVKYGIRTSPSPLRLRISARTEGPRLLVEIANTGRWCGEGGNGNGGDADDPIDHGAGVGLANVRERLARLYPGRHRFDVGQDDGWVRARIEITEGMPA